MGKFLNSHNIPSLEPWDIARYVLKDTDWTQLPDCGLTSTCKTNFATYRASLRAIKSSEPSHADVTWPTEPTLEWE